MKKLIHEIHRRSLWQVLGIYVLGSWLILQVVNELADALNLPEWAASLAVFLLIVGLPVVLATAFVQEGVSHSEGTDSETHLDTTAGGSPMERAPAHASPSRGFLTWRHAIIGGVIAFALWGVAAAIWLVAAGPPEGAGDTAPPGADTELAIESIAVLAFADMSPDGDQEHFADGIAAEILDGLSRVSGLKVPARSSSFQYKGKNPDVRTVGRELDVQTVLDGSVRKSEGSLRVTVQLTSADDGFQMWSETYNRRDEDIFVVQEDIARSVLAALGLDVADSDLPSFDAPAGGIEAHELYLLGLSRFHGRATLDDVEAALSWFERAVAADPGYARAHAAVALIAAVLPQWSDMPPEIAAVRTHEAAIRAIELDPTLIEPYQALCQSLGWNEWQWEEALAACERAIELNPNSELTHMWFGELLILVGRFDDAHVAILRSKELSPLSGFVKDNVHGWLHNMRAEYDSTNAIERPVLQVDPDNVFARRNLMVALFSMARPGDRDELTEAMLRSASTGQDSATNAAFVAAFLAASADSAMRAAALAHVPEIALPGSNFRVLIPQYYVWLGDGDSAIGVLQRMLDARDSYLPLTLRLPELHPLHDDPRFREVWRGVFGTLPMETP